jgi:hypothetical protein
VRNHSFFVANECISNGISFPPNKLTENTNEKKNCTENFKKNSYYDPVLALNGLVGKALVLPSASIMMYVLVANGERNV